MSTSRFFNHLEHMGEISLYDSLVIESIQISGFDIRYIMRDNDIEPILYESKNNKFLEENSWLIEANIPDDLMGWQGDGYMLNHFGIQMDYSGSILISKTRWQEVISERKGHNHKYRDRPMEGDLIYFGYGKEKFNHTLFQINHVDYNDQQWQHGRTFVYRLKCSLYKPTSDDVVDVTHVSTSIDELINSSEAISQSSAFDEKVDELREHTKDQNSIFGGF